MLGQDPLAALQARHELAQGPLGLPGPLAHSLLAGGLQGLGARGAALGGPELALELPDAATQLLRILGLRPLHHLLRNRASGMGWL